MRIGLNTGQQCWLDLVSLFGAVARAVGTAVAKTIATTPAKIVTSICLNILMHLVRSAPQLWRAKQRITIDQWVKRGEETIGVPCFSHTRVAS